MDLVCLKEGLASEGFLHHYRELPGRQRRMQLEDLGRQIRRLHDQGIFTAWWKDYSGLPVATGDLPHAASGNCAAKIWQREKNLSRAYLQTKEHFGRAETLRFLRGYLGGIQDGPARDFVTRLTCRSHWRLPAPQGKKFFAASDLVSVRRLGRIRILWKKSPEGAMLAKLLAEDPLAVLNSGQPLPGRGSRCRTARISFAGENYFLKAFTSGRTLSRRARNVWMLSWQLRMSDIPVPAPLLLREGPASTSYLLTDFAEGYRCLADYWPQAEPEERKTLLVRSAILLGRLHRLGWIHGDFNWNNILVGPQADLLLVDLDCAKRVRWFTRERPFRDVQHFLRDLLRADGPGDEGKNLFVGIWRRWAGSIVEAEA